jgi:hypothetical protein
VVVSNYDAGESFAAGDEHLPRFDNTRLRSMWAELRTAEPNRAKRLVIWAIILRGIFGEADVRGGA